MKILAHVSIYGEPDAKTKTEMESTLNKTMNDRYPSESYDLNWKSGDCDGKTFTMVSACRKP